MKKGEIKITSRSRDELNSTVMVGDEKYLVQTERGGRNKSSIITRIYLNGKIVSKKETDCGVTSDSADADKKIDEIMQNQHRSGIDSLRPDKKQEVKQASKSPSDYIRGVKTLLMRKNQKKAIELLGEALEQYPDDPFVLSYYGCLDAIVNRRYKAGIDTCNRAILALKGKMPFGEEFFYPVLYLNLGRVYLAAGRKKNALTAFKKGLEMDNENSELMREVRMLGMRKKTAIPFLGRSNPINKYIGMLLRKIGK